jgi:CBS domain-containing membrane protein
MPTVRDWMTAEPLTVRRSESVAAVYDMMSDNGFRHVPVVDDDDELVGIVSHRDLAAALGDSIKAPRMAQAELLETRTADQIMTRGVETVSPDDDLSMAAEMMLENKFGCVPVCEGTHLVGILTESDFVRLAVQG